MFRVSIIGQDAKSLEGLVRNLGQSGFSCSLTNDSEVAVASVLEQSPDIVLVENDSYYRISEVSREIRRASDVPIVAIVRGDLLSRVNGHFNKVHDFVAKPFHPEELQLRMKRLLRRAGADGEEILKSRELTINMARCEVFVGDRAVVLTFKEYELLKFLVSNQGRVCTRDVLLDKVWGLDYYGGDRTVDVHIRRLRSKIEDATHTFIDTVRNIGYRFRAER